MSSSLQVTSSPTPGFKPIFEKALEEHKKKTGNDLTTHPLAAQIQGCDSPGAILTVLEGKANELNQSRSSDERLTKWLNPTVNILNALSVTLGQGIATVSSSRLLHHDRSVSLVKIQVFPPTQVIFSGINILLVVSFLPGPTEWASLTPY